MKRMIKASESSITIDDILSNEDFRQLVMTYSEGDEIEYESNKISEGKYELSTSIYDYSLGEYLGPVNVTVDLNDVDDIDSYIEDLAFEIGDPLRELVDEADNEDMDW